MVTKRADTKLKDQNLYMIKLNKKIVTADYLKTFFSSDYGLECIRTMFTESSIPHLNISSANMIRAGVPSLEIQNKIVETQKKLVFIKDTILEIENELTNNPVDNKQSDLIHNVSLSIEELKNQVSPLLCEESIIHEFKSSFRTPYPDYPQPNVNSKGQTEYILGKETFSSKKQIQSYLEFIVMKTIASFLNTRGGKLVIGVHEYANEKEIIGIDREGFESNDHYERHFIQQLNNRFSALIVSKYINTEITKIKGTSVLLVECKTSDEIIYLTDNQGNDLVYVRTKNRFAFYQRSSRAIKNKKTLGLFYFKYLTLFSKIFIFFYKSFDYPYYYRCIISWPTK